MKYTQKSFSVHMGGDGYEKGWDRIFGDKYIKTKCYICKEEIEVVKDGNGASICESCEANSG